MCVDAHQARELTVTPFAGCGNVRVLVVRCKQLRVDNSFQDAMSFEFNQEWSYGAGGSEGMTSEESENEVEASDEDPDAPAVLAQGMKRRVSGKNSLSNSSARSSSGGFASKGSAQTGLVSVGSGRGEANGVAGGGSRFGANGFRAQVAQIASMSAQRLGAIDEEAAASTRRSVQESTSIGDGATGNAGAGDGIVMSGPHDGDGLNAIEGAVDVDDGGDDDGDGDDEEDPLEVAARERVAARAERKQRLELQLMPREREPPAQLLKNPYTAHLEIIVRDVEDAADEHRMEVGGLLVWFCPVCASDATTLASLTTQTHSANTYIVVAAQVLSAREALRSKKSGRQRRRESLRQELMDLLHAEAKPGSDVDQAAERAMYAFALVACSPSPSFAALSLGDILA